MQFVVAIDGPAASGKGTISKEVAREYGFGHLDTGLLYRAVAARVLEGEEPIAAARDLQPEDMARANLRTAEVGRHASIVAAMPEVRAALFDFQRIFAGRDGGAVLDGRDIGTAICPDADVKLFVTADLETRARRRYLELSAHDAEITEEQLKQDLYERDKRDSERGTTPMRVAEDAVVLDTSEMSVEQAVQAAFDVILKRLDLKKMSSG